MQNTTMKPSTIKRVLIHRLGIPTNYIFTSNIQDITKGIQSVLDTGEHHLEIRYRKDPNDKTNRIPDIIAFNPDKSTTLLTHPDTTDA